MKNKLIVNSISLGIVLLFIALWEAIASSSSKITFFFASPTEIGRTLMEDTINGKLPMHLAITGYETIAGFILGIIFGTFIGFMLWYSPVIARITRPYIIVLGAIPVFAFAPVIILWFGTGIVMKIALSTFGTFLVCLTQAYEGAQDVNPEEFRLFKLYKATRIQILQKAIFPSSLSWVLSSMKLSIGIALLGAFIGEFISANKGIGYYMVRAGSLYEISSVFAGGIYLVFLALILHGLVVYITKNRMRLVKMLAVSAKVRNISRE